MTPAGLPSSRSGVGCLPPSDREVTRSRKTTRECIHFGGVSAKAASVSMKAGRLLNAGRHGSWNGGIWGFSDCGVVKWGAVRWLRAHLTVAIRNARSGVRTHAEIPPVDLKSTALTTRPSWHEARLSQVPLCARRISPLSRTSPKPGRQAGRQALEHASRTPPLRCMSVGIDASGSGSRHQATTAVTCTTGAHLLVMQESARLHVRVTLMLRRRLRQL